MVIVDECHHISAFSFEKVIKAAHARYVYGLTATPTRQDGHHPIIFMHCGPIRYKVDTRSQSEKHPFEHIVLPRFTSFKMPPRSDNEKWHIQKFYTAVTESDTRNQMILEDVLKAVADKRNSIILAHRTAHVDMLADMLKERGVKALVLTGRLKDKQRKEVRNQLEEAHRRSSPGNSGYREIYW
jgi:superfamily II DNA or RNA helicase